jgi:hypothetical protein
MTTRTATEKTIDPGTQVTTVTHETSSSSTVTTLATVVIIVSVLAATVALAWHNTLNGEAATGIIFAILAGVLGAGAHAAGTRAGSQATINPPPDS